ncbi:MULTISPECIES: lysophospholipid acyltransferase family protein [Shewanella]|uniref:lysophospholipid acyltransferase family protein n=1 Tax=Shewanella TaxID=22 RepID=UPI000E8FCE62|nr:MULTISPECIES: 1-acyl-sn-glycerol-3-phosphate acyltransferase [Shewanella]RPA31990.1 1-acyl-sn-glycerol-3-phosphate acyltransferase [Shewanella frigidimarina]HBF48238.1 1-acyl-sn-glycerol-3-phosphate acyltransferase [Shewanella frigidimarina]
MPNQHHTRQHTDTIVQKKATVPKLSGLRYIPRWVGGVCCYIAFGLGGLLSSLTILPLLRFWPGEKTVRVARAQKAVSWMFKAFVAMLSFAGVIAVSTKNIEALQQTKGKVVIANHPTLVDVVVLISLMPNAGCIVKQSLWRNPFIRGVLASAGYIPNRGADWLLHDCQQVLRTDTNLIIFPEGTRTLTGNIVNPFARGAANIALRTQTDILPVVLRTDVAGLTKQQSWYQIPRQTINMSVEIGTSMSYLLYDAKRGNEAKMARQLTRDLQQFYLDTLKQPIKSH